MLLGFLVRALHLGIEAWKRFQFAGLSDRLVLEARNTFVLSAAATAAVLICGLVVAYAARLFLQQGMRIVQRTASLGYAMPGTNLALGILIATAGVDCWISRSAKR